MVAAKAHLFAPTPVNATANRQTPNGGSDRGQRIMGRERRRCTILLILTGCDMAAMTICKRRPPYTG